MRLLMPQVTNVSKACMGNVELFPAEVQVAFPCQSSHTLTETCLSAISVSAQVFAVKSLGVACLVSNPRFQCLNTHLGLHESGDFTIPLTKPQTGTDLLRCNL